jgi:AcrR family transcriptional regulator
MSLTHALVLLVLEKRYDAITVQDLLDRAEVGRSTFYSHYRGKDDLLLRSFEAMLDTFAHSLPPGNPRLYPVRELFEHVGHVRHLYQALGRARVLDRQYQVAVERLSASIERRLSARAGRGTVPPHVAARACAGALCALLRWWIENDTGFTAAQMDQLFHASLAG